MSKCPFWTPKLLVVGATMIATLACAEPTQQAQPVHDPVVILGPSIAVVYDNGTTLLIEVPDDIRANMSSGDIDKELQRKFSEWMHAHPEVWQVFVNRMPDNARGRGPKGLIVRYEKQ